MYFLTGREERVSSNMRLRLALTSDSFVEVPPNLAAKQTIISKQSFKCILIFTSNLFGSLFWNKYVFVEIQKGFSFIAYFELESIL
jgi:hypothetical protein